MALLPSGDRQFNPLANCVAVSGGLAFIASVTGARDKVSPNKTRRSLESALVTHPLDLFRDPGILLRRVQERTGPVELPVEVRPDTWVPAIEVRQHDDRIEIVVELPGIEWMDVRVEVIGNRLVVQGDRRHDLPSDVIPRAVRRTERRYGHFYREFELPMGADLDRIEATLDKGMLRINIPLSQEQNAGRRIPVRTSSRSTEE